MSTDPSSVFLIWTHNSVGKSAKLIILKSLVRAQVSPQKYLYEDNNTNNNNLGDSEVWCGKNF